jgi:MFS family permease
LNCKPAAIQTGDAMQRMRLLLSLAVALFTWTSIAEAQHGRRMSSTQTGVGGSGDQEFDCLVTPTCAQDWSMPQRKFCLDTEGVQCEVKGGKTDREKRRDGALSSMMMGSVVFVMSIFYLVNFKDDDIRKYTWQILSTTVSIFTSVMIFSGITEFWTFFIPPETPEMMILGVNFGFFLFWFVCLQVSIAIISGANCEGAGVKIDREGWLIADTMRADYGEEVPEREVRNLIGEKSVAVMDGVEVFVRRCKVLKEERQCKMACWATLLAHLTGFAGIQVGGTMQHMDAFRNNTGMLLLAAFINQIFVMGLFRIADAIRTRTSGMDGVTDSRDELYHEFVAEAENDAASLSISFLLVQALRFMLSGVLPRNNGTEAHGAEPMLDYARILGLYGLGLGIFLCSVLLYFVSRNTALYKNVHGRRYIDLMKNQGAMVFAWCVLGATGWQAEFSGVMDSIGGAHSMTGSLLLALVLSCSAMVAIFGLDKIEDQGKEKKDNHQVGKLVRDVITALSILVGFSWEHAFSNSIDAVAAQTSMPHLCNLCMGLIVALSIIPAWRKYILEKVMIHTQKDEHGGHDVASSHYEQLEFEDMT